MRRQAIIAAAVNQFDAPVVLFLLFVINLLTLFSTHSEIVISAAARQERARRIVTG